MAIRKWKARLKNTVTPRKTHANETKRTKNTHATPCIPSIEMNPHMEIDTCK